MDNLLKMIFPPRCPACREPMEDDGSYIHPECEKAFKLITEPRCFKCGRHMEEAEKALCPECESKTHMYSYGFPLFEYNDTAQKAMIDYKKNGWKRNGEYFASEIVKHLSGQIKRMKPEVLVPVPITKKRLGERGFNQSEYLAIKIGEKLGIPVEPGLLKRTGAAVQQKKLSGTARKENTDYGIECTSDNVSYRRICIIDDVYTTGGTINACASALMEAGAVETGFVTAFAVYLS
ncbi:MAG: ComF family protein [Lachnospiraceae bacterium]|nr:ComF family protein [Lachnospiraceae bacterium]